MPGPRSTPMGWTPQARRNMTGSHGTPATETRPRRSGKTAWTHASGQWAQGRANKARRMAEAGA